MDDREKMLRARRRADRFELEVIELERRVADLTARLSDLGGILGATSGKLAAVTIESEARFEDYRKQAEEREERLRAVLRSIGGEQAESLAFDPIAFAEWLEVNDPTKDDPACAKCEHKKGAHATDVPQECKLCNCAAFAWRVNVIDLSTGPAGFPYDMIRRASINWGRS